MSKKVTQVIPVPYLLISFSLIPIFLIANFLPAHASTEMYLRIDNFLEQHLFGTVGFWSSLFPFSSRLSTSYISLFGPIFAAVSVYLTHAKIVIDPEQYRSLTLKKYVYALFVIAVLQAIFVSINYFGDVDLAGHNHKFRLFGVNALMYSIFASAMLLCYYAITLLGYVVFCYIPRLFIERWRNGVL
ncbi:hypothetical protein [Pseudomonas sp. B28(2017)]|uniref:hypothetical protein n=1 Tax=Pseudomonas sp. B28(2017) TaxID=1981730 RepID=UPI000A1FC57F|nr:hypothetical protein [Pseudomonas sp. B28(2017)]